MHILIVIRIQYVFDGEDTLLEQNENGQIFRTYVRGSGIDELYGVLINSNQDGVIASSEAFFLRTDHLGSVREVVKSDGQPQQQYSYSAYGVPSVLVASGSSEIKLNRLYIA